MNGQTRRSVALLVGAVILLAVGGFALLSNHIKTGVGLLALGVVVVGVSIASVFVARSSQ
ncbi:MAG TPA: hypothetical protein VKX46_14245 [Ktedonobacteraceae bacterium]|jgi:hypothetical protein|nr:hypothetical protein [Ktedonobacteraceae bacterium]